MSSAAAVASEANVTAMKTNVVQRNAHRVNERRVVLFMGRGTQFECAGKPARGESERLGLTCIDKPTSHRSVSGLDYKSRGRLVSIQLVQLAPRSGNAGLQGPETTEATNRFHLTRERKSEPIGSWLRSSRTCDDASPTRPTLTGGRRDRRGEHRPKNLRTLCVLL